MARVNIDGKGEGRWKARELGIQDTEGYGDKQMPHDRCGIRAPCRRRALAPRTACMGRRMAMRRNDGGVSSRSLWNRLSKAIKLFAFVENMFNVSHCALSKWHLLCPLLSRCFSYLQIPQTWQRHKGCHFAFSWVFWPLPLSACLYLLGSSQLSESLPTSLSLSPPSLPTLDISGEVPSIAGLTCRTGSSSGESLASFLRLSHSAPGPGLDLLSSWISCDIQVLPYLQENSLTWSYSFIQASGMYPAMHLIQSAMDPATHLIDSSIQTELILVSHFSVSWSPDTCYTPSLHLTQRNQVRSILSCYWWTSFPCFFP